MAKTRKRLARLAYWKWVVATVGAYALVTFLVNRVSLAFSALAFILIVWLAIVLARRFRDIGWPAWLGPSILFFVLFGLTAVAVGYAVAHPGEPQQLYRLLAVCRLINLTLTVLLLIVAGCMPGKPAQNIELARVFD